MYTCWCLTVHSRGCWLTLVSNHAFSWATFSVNIQVFTSFASSFSILFLNCQQIVVVASSLEMARASASNSPRRSAVGFNLLARHYLSGAIPSTARRLTSSPWLSSMFGIFEELRRHQLNPATSVISQPRVS